MPEAGSAPLAPAGLADDLVLRHARITATLQELGASCLVAVRDQAVTYLTGYTTMTWKMHSRPVVAVLTATGRLTVVAAETEADSARLRIPGAEVRPYVLLEPVPREARLPDGHIQFAPHAARVLGEVIEDAGSGTVAVDALDAAWPPVGQLTRLIPGLAGRTQDASAWLWDLRLHKTQWELGRMAAASAVLDRTYARLQEELRPGRSEREISRRFSIIQLEEGAHEVGPHAVVAGPDRGLFGFPTDKVWEAGDLLYVDGAPIVDGYWSDYCRTFAARDVRPAERDGYARARAGIDAAVAAFPAVRTAAGLGSAMASAMEIAPHDVGFGRFGHGIGLHVPEPPSLHAADPTPLEDGCVLCVEPAVVHDGVNYVVEEEYVVTSTGLELLSPRSPEHILVL